MQIFNIVEELEKERKKNKQLKELCDKYEEEHKTTFEIWQKDIKANKKAIEYIEKYCIDGVENEYNTPQTVFEEENGNEKDHARIELLNILRGNNE